MTTLPPAITRIRRTYLAWRQAGPKTREGRALFRLLGGLLQAECESLEDLLHVIAIYLQDLNHTDLKRAYARAQTLQLPTQTLITKAA